MDFTSANLCATKGYHRCAGLPTSDFLLVETAAFSLIGGVCDFQVAILEDISQHLS